MLEKIIADKKEELEQRRKAVPVSEMEARIAQCPGTLDFASALKGDGVSLIAEVKKASPSKGIIRRDFNPVALARTYADNGASAISVLTETKYFGGHLNHLSEIRKDVAIPLLRKDFIFDTYQVYESRACGADAQLLIAVRLIERRNDAAHRRVLPLLPLMRPDGDDRGLVDRSPALTAEGQCAESTDDRQQPMDRS